MQRSHKVAQYHIPQKTGLTVQTPKVSTQALRDQELCLPTSSCATFLLKHHCPTILGFSPSKSTAVPLIDSF